MYLKLEVTLKRSNFIGILIVRSKTKNGQVEESYRTQSVVQGSQEWNQEAKESPSQLHQRDGSQVLEEPETVACLKSVSLLNSSLCATWSGAFVCAIYSVSLLLLIQSTI
ncbi:hypothetical protein MTR67_024718 [Solanum verrucosum]|uniref:Uncharacterized protein n=1 Tax=Solanum verrucosum TaxID=315347 RepID=A0AAF0QY08_SOLVR|nr:hypothetical protein MTR67_024718 [Solanum verrucosum]